MSIDAILSPVFLSLRVGACATILVTILGTIVGRALARSSWRYKVLLETIFLLPMVLPPTVIGFFLIIIFGNNSPIGKWVESLFQQSIMFTSTLCDYRFYSCCISAYVPISENGIFYRKCTN